MRLPKLNTIQRSKQSTTVFGGYNHNPVIGDGEWCDMRNMTSDHYPLLAPYMNKRSAELLFRIDGAISNNGLNYIRSDRNSVKFVNSRYGKEIDLELTSGEKKLVNMGAYVIILPDKKWVNTADFSYGDIEASVEVNKGISFQVCDKAGNPISFEASAKRPANPADGAYWIDTDGTIPVLKQWYEAARMWMEQESYLKVAFQATHTDRPDFQKGDVVKAAAWHGGYERNGVKFGVWVNEDPVIYEADVAGLLQIYVVRGIAEYGDPESPVMAAGDPFTWTRNMPDLDFVIESGNRLWGCKFGQTEDGFINEIYASKLGDFKNWTSFQGVSTDSYRASLGADGKFTGAVSYNGKPVFFKEDCMVIVYGAYPAQYQVIAIDCNGVQEGCCESLAVGNNKLYYWSRNGVCMYDGSLPVTVSAALGEMKLIGAAAGYVGDKYYLLADAVNSKFNGCYVLDTRIGVWHRYDALQSARTFVHDGDVYAWINYDTPNIYRATIDRMRGVGEVIWEENKADPVSWMVESGDIGLSTPDAKYISQLTVRMSISEGSEVSLWVKYDFEDEWIFLTTILSTSLRSFDVPIRLKRCDTMRLRIVGIGDARIYSITKTIEQGGDAR